MQSSHLTIDHGAPPCSVDFSLGQHFLQQSSKLNLKIWDFWNVSSAISKNHFPNPFWCKPQSDFLDPPQQKNLYLHNPMLGLANVRPLGMLKQEAGDRPGNLGWFRQRWVGGCLTIEWEQQQRLHVQASVQKYKGSVGTLGLYAWWSVCLSLCSWKQWVSNEFHISRLQPPLIQVNSWYRSSWNPRLWMGYLILSSPQKAWLQSLLGNPPNITLVQLHE